MGLDLSVDFDTALRGRNPARHQREHIAALETKRIAEEDARTRGALDHEIGDVDHRKQIYQSAMDDAKEKEPEQQKRRSRRGRPRGSGKVQQVRDVPSDLIVAIRQSHPVFMGKDLEDASPLSLTDTISAFCAFHLGYDGDDLSDRAAEAVKILKQSDEGLVSMNSRMRHLEQQNQRLESLIEEALLSSNYLLFDRLGFRRTNVGAPGQIDFEEPELERLNQTIRAAAKEKVAARRVAEGRPIS